MFMGDNITDDKTKGCLLPYCTRDEVSELFDTLSDKGITFHQALNVWQTILL